MQLRKTNDFIIGKERVEQSELHMFSTRKMRYAGFGGNVPAIFLLQELKKHSFSALVWVKHGNKCGAIIVPHLNDRVK